MQILDVCIPQERTDMHLIVVAVGPDRVGGIAGKLHHLMEQLVHSMHRVVYDKPLGQI